jgi:hypothetical protein
MPVIGKKEEILVDFTGLKKEEINKLESEYEDEGKGVAGTAEGEQTLYESSSMIPDLAQTSAVTAEAIAAAIAKEEEAKAAADKAAADKAAADKATADKAAADKATADKAAADKATADKAAADKAAAEHQIRALLPKPSNSENIDIIKLILNLIEFIGDNDKSLEKLSDEGTIIYNILIGLGNQSYNSKNKKNIETILKKINSSAKLISKQLKNTDINNNINNITNRLPYNFDLLTFNINNVDANWLTINWNTKNDKSKTAYLHGILIELLIEIYMNNNKKPHFVNLKTEQNKINLILCKNTFNLFTELNEKIITNYIGLIETNSAKLKQGDNLLKLINNIQIGENTRGADLSNPLDIIRQIGGSYFNERLNELNKIREKPDISRKEREAAEDDVVIEYKNNPLYSPDMEKANYTDRIVFIAVTFMFRAISLVLVQSAINTQFITTFNKAFTYYFLIYSILFIIWILIVNMRKDNHIVGLLFYYVNANYDSSIWLTRITVHLLLQLLVLPIPILLTPKFTSKTETDSFEKRERLYNTLTFFTFVIWIITSLVALRA